MLFWYRTRATVSEFHQSQFKFPLCQQPSFVIWDKTRHLSEPEVRYLYYKDSTLQFCSVILRIRNIYVKEPGPQHTGSKD